MSQLNQVINALADNNITVSSENGNLKIQAPKGALTDSLKMMLKENKEELLAWIIEREGEKKLPSTGKIAPVTEGPLSYSQKRLWFLNQFDRKTPAYNMPAVFKLTGELRPDVLEKALREICARHHIIRTSLLQKEEEPWQKVMDEWDFTLKQIDLSGYTGKEQTVKAEELISRECNTPFDLSGDLMLRACLLKLDGSSCYFIITMHHIASDGWSLGLLSNELQSIYKAFCEQDSHSLPDIDFQYAQYALWQQQLLESGRLDKELDYWKQNLSSIPDLHNIPGDKKRPRINRYRGDVVTSTIEKDLLEKIKQFCGKHKITLFMFLQAILSIIIARYSREQDIVIGSPIAGRTREEFEPLIGFFVNNIMLRQDLSDNPVFTDLLKRIEKNTMEAFDNQHIPFEYLVDTLQPERSLSHSPLFQIMLILNNTGEISLDLPGISSEVIQPPAVSAKFDITLSCTEQAGKLDMVWEYNKDLFFAGTITTMAGHFENLIHSLLQKPEQPVLEAPFMSDEEKNDFFQDYNTAAKLHNNEMFISRIFEEQCRLFPDGAAVIDKQETISYAQLNSAANQIARFLIDRGIKPGMLVGVYLERSWKLTACLLGILKSGAAFVPLDPEYPAQRLKYMIEGSGLKSVLLSDKTQSSFTASKDIAVFNISDSKHNLFQGGNEENITTPLTGFSPESPAYVIYTSGSTGKPKGIAIPHKALSNFFAGMQQVLSLTPEDRILALTTIAFDISYLELFLPLLNGASCFIAENSYISDSSLLQQLIEEYNINIMQATPATWQLLLAGGWKGKEDLTILCGGEALHASLAEKLLSCSKTLWNVYGPTEATIWVAAKKIEEIPGGDQVMPIGGILPNTGFYILDQYGNPVPQGVPGELHIAGDNLAIGYHGLDSLTEERFIYSPLEELKQQRLYKTGDLVRRLPNGDLDFLGRCDNQVKIRGFRIELGEIESVILTADYVKEAVVIVREDKPGLQQITAYLVFKEKEADDKLLDQLRASIKKKLPEYMIPSFFIILDALPLTENKKIDRKALPKPELHHDQNKTYVAPESENEIVLCEIWQDVIGFDRISVTDNFFEIGGHSLLAVTMINRIKETTGKEISLQVLFEYQTVKELAEYLEKTHQSNVNLPEALPDLENRYQPFPLTDVQQAYWIGRSDDFALGNVGTHVYLEFFIKELDVDRFTKCMNILIRRHDMLRITFSNLGEQSILEEVPEYVPHILDLTSESKEEGLVLFNEMRDELSHQVFDVTKWPLFDIRLTNFKDGTWKLHYSMDSIILDAGSSVILFNELLRLYSNPQEQLPNLELSFRDYVLAERSIQMTPTYEKAAQYWKDRLDDFPMAPDLPLAQDINLIKTPKFERHEKLLDKKTWQSLQERAKATGVTPTVVLLGIFSQVLRFFSNNSSFVLNLTLFNRLPLHGAVDQILGDFTSLVLLEIADQGTLSFEQALVQIQKRLWTDLEHSYFSGVEVQRELSRLHGKTITMPIVVTSTLGIESINAQGSALDVPKEELTNLDPIQEPFSISQTPQVWLDHQIVERQEGLFLCWDSVEGLFPPNMVDNMFDAYITLLEKLAVSGDAWSNNHFDLLPSYQKDIRTEVNNTKAGITDDMLHTLFYSQVQKRPDALAIRSKNRQLTYLELDRIVYAIGSRLGELAVKPNQLVAVVMEKGWEQVAAALGILAAGGAYLPIDANIPESRILALIEQGEAEVVLSTESILKTLTLPEHMKSVPVDSISPAPGTVQLPPVQSVTDLAYVIFTSGSTGIPKGVMIDHRGAVNTILDINQRYGVTEKDKVLALSALNFDLSVYDIFGLLAAGGTIVMPDEAERREPDSWAGYLETEGITIWNTVPALMQLLVDYLEQHESPMPLEVVMMSGDWIPVGLPDRIRALKDGDIKIFSLGGATEASIWSIDYPITAVSPDWTSIPYGKPLKNQTFHILKEGFIPCPDYITGELYIGGTGVALGYWKDKEKTEASFVTNPETGERLYKTGDTGRYLPDGTIEFQGRVDHQVKIHGYRIELGEIESHLMEHPQVANAVVIAKGERAKDKKLVAYVVPEQQEEQSSDDAIGALKESGNQITDKNERARFKLEMKGIRTFSDPVETILLPAGQEVKHLVLQDKQKKAGSENQKILPLDMFGKVFEWASAEKPADLMLPKYFYPSAGSLYPVQVYINVPRDAVEDVPPALYYYHPLENSLYRLSDSLETPGKEDWSFKIFLVGDMDAIEPMYGRYAADFCVLEAGYMTQLLFAGSPAGIGIAETENGNFDTFKKAAGLADNTILLRSFEAFPGENEEARDNKVLAAKNISSPEELVKIKTDEKTVSADLTRIGRKSYRTYQQNPIGSDDLFVILQEIETALSGYCREEINLGIYLYLKEEGVENISSGYYYFNPVTSELQKLAAGESCRQIFQGNAEIYDQGGFALFLTASQEESAQSRDNLLFYSGIIVQAITNLGLSRQVGLCAIGTVNQDLCSDALHLDNEEILHSFIGGRISEEQISTIEQYSASAHSLDPRKEIIAFLEKQLPSYMVPRMFVLLDEMPLTPNGKVNRKALPDPVEEARSGKMVPPRSRMELKLAEIWKDILKIDEISIEDSFFELGGNSLVSMNLISRVEEEFQVRLQIAELYDLQNINNMAKRLLDGGCVKNKRSLTVFRKTGGLTPLYIVPGIVGECHYLYKLANLLDPERPVYAFQSQGIEEGTTPLESIEEMAEFYVQEILENQPEGPYYIAGHSFGCHVAHDMVKRFEKMGKEVPLLIILDGGKFLEREISDEESLLIALHAVADSRGEKCPITLEDFKGKTKDELYTFAHNTFIEMGMWPEYSTIDNFFRAIEVMNIQKKMRYNKHEDEVKRVALYVTGETAGRLEYEKKEPLDHEWRITSREPVIVEEASGGHTSMVEDPHVNTLAVQLEDTMKKYD